MIILDEDEHQLPKLAHPAPIYAPPVNRCTTPTSTVSLPDYDTSEAQQLKQNNKLYFLQKQRFRVWKIVLLILAVYCFLTLVIGVPLIALRLRRAAGDLQYQSTTWNPQQASVSSAPGQEIISSPPAFDEATNCDQWISMDREGGDDLLISKATYNMSLDTGLFLGSNGSYRADSTTKPLSGTLFVDINDDPSATDVQILVEMLYSSRSLRSRTHVCLVDAYDNNGFYIYIPSNLTERDQLSFDISMLFPQTQYLNITSFMVMLPLFQQHYGDISPRIVFSQAILGGPMSNVSVDSITADRLFVISSPGSIKGTFGASDQIVLETMSADIDANITVHVTGAISQPSIRLNTGNRPLSANITLQVSKPKSILPKIPKVYIDANTFNAPLVMSVSQSPPLPTSLPPLPVFVHAGNNLGVANVSMDSHYEGTFLVSTEYALAIVDGTSSADNNSSSKNPDLISSTSYSSRMLTDAFGRTLYYDAVDDSQVTGWVGRGRQPQVISTGSPGYVEVKSVLSPVVLDLAS